MTDSDWRLAETEQLRDILDPRKDRTRIQSILDVNPSLKYVILSTPGCGAERLAGYIRKIPKAGIPYNYFQPKLLKRAGHPERRPGGLFEYFGDLVRRRSDPDGAFGMILQFGHFEKLFGKNSETLAYGVAFLDQFDRIIWMHHSDKILQAVRAERIGGVVSDEFNKKVKSDFTDPLTEFSRIAALLKKIIDYEHGWQTLLQKISNQTMMIDYDMLRGNITEELSRILHFLNVPFVQTQIDQMPIADASFDAEYKMRQRFLDYVNGQKVPTLIDPNS